jgi:hypothetical protein
MNTRVAAGGTLIRRYALALTPTGAGIEAAVTAASVPPLSGGPCRHGSAAAHAITIADGASGSLSRCDKDRYAGLRQERLPHSELPRPAPVAAVRTRAAGSRYLGQISHR